MSRSSLFVFAAVMAMFGVAILSGHPPWGAVTGVAILLTAAAMAAGALAAKPSPGLLASEPKSASQKIPASLVTLSATAILAVYAAGYQRTRAAADQFDAQTARLQPSAPRPTIVLPPKPLEPAATTPAETPRKATAAEPPAAGANSDTAPKSATTPGPPTTSASTPVPAGPVNEPPAETATAAIAKAQASYKDGTFLGWGRCRHGNIQASVAIAGGQIVATEITQCLTRYSCSWIAALPGQVITRQSADVDYVSGATESTEAFYDAVTSALAAARE